MQQLTSKKGMFKDLQAKTPINNHQHILKNNAKCHIVTTSNKKQRKIIVIKTVFWINYYTKNILFCKYSIYPFISHLILY